MKEEKNVSYDEVIQALLKNIKLTTVPEDTYLWSKALHEVAKAKALQVDLDYMLKDDE